MFQFNDFDDEAESFLSIPLDNTLIETNTNSINRIHHGSNICDMNLSTKDDSIFDDGDEELLSFVENIDCSFNQSTQKSTSINNNGNVSHLLPHESPISSKQPKNLSTNKENCGQGRLDSFIARKSPASSCINPKRTSKLVTIIDELPSTPKQMKLEYEREFPGPAGLRLKRSGDVALSEELNDSGLRQQLSTSVVDDTVSDSITWLELKREILTKSSEQSKIIDEFSVISLKKLGHVSRKIPLFAAVISSVDPSTSDPSVTLKDPTGMIRGTFLRDLWEQYSHLLTVGSALLLRRVSMLSRSRKQSLNITIYNVDTIYSLKSDNVSVLTTRVTPLTVLDSLYKKSNGTVAAAIETSTAGSIVKKTSEPSSNEIPSPNASHSVISTDKDGINPNNEQANLRTHTSVPSFTSSVDNELEGIDLDSLLEDF